MNRLAVLFVCVAIFSQGDTELHLFPFSKGDKIGLIDATGKEVIAAQFGNAGDATRFQDGLANVAFRSGWGYIDAKGTFVVPPVYWFANRFSEGIGCVQLPGESMGWAFVDRSGRLLARGLKAESSFHEGLAAELITDKWGYLSQNMQVAIQPKFDYAGPFQEGRASVCVGHKCGYIDKAGNLIVPAKYNLTQPFSDGMGLVELFERNEPLQKGIIGLEGQKTTRVYYWGAIDKSGTEAIRPQFVGLTNFSDGYAFAETDDVRKWGIIDRSGHFLVSPRFDEATAFSESVAAVRVRTKWGYVDTQGSWSILPTFNSAEPFENGLARASLGGDKYGYIDHRGGWVWRVDSPSQ